MCVHNIMIFFRRSFPLHPETNKYAMKMVSIMEGKEWKDARNQMSPIFTSTRMKGIMPVVHEVGDSFINYLNRSELNKDNLNAKELTQLCVVETLGRIGCGVKPNILDDKEPYNNAFYQVNISLDEFIYFSSSNKMIKFKFSS